MRSSDEDRGADTVSTVVDGLVLIPAKSQAQIAQIRELFLEYSKSLGFSLCFQNFDEELAGLPGDYSPPGGLLLLAEYNGEPTGCVAFHRLDAETCEMKRLYLRPRFRGKGAGKSLAEAVIAQARKAGYRRIRLDTVAPVMQDAVRLYRQLGFKEIAAYRPNPIADALYMELLL